MPNVARALGTVLPNHGDSMPAVADMGELLRQVWSPGVSAPRFKATDITNLDDLLFLATEHKK
jgi:hypothetical protein